MLCLLLVSKGVDPLTVCVSTEQVHLGYNSAPQGWAGNCADHPQVRASWPLHMPASKAEAKATTDLRREPTVGQRLHA